MNKQEAIEKIEGNLMYEITRYIGKAVNIYDVIDIVKQIDEPQKPKVPQVAVEFYERYKDDDLVLGEWFDDFYSPEAIEEFPRMDELTEWLYDNNDEINRQREFALATLVTLGIDAVEVEKEKRYTAKLKLTDEYLCCESQFKDLLHYKVPDSSAKEVKAYHFTEDDLVKYHIWGNDNYEVKKVEE